jgi:hypothetical protein
MRTATIVTLLCMAGAVVGCSHDGKVEFVSSNPDSVLLDFSAKPPGQLSAANDTATQQCQIYSPRTAAVLESLNTRGEGGVIRATYLCEGPKTADASSGSSGKMLRRQ